MWKGFPGSSDGKESVCNAGDLGSIPGLGISSGEGHDNPFQYSWLENPHGERSLEGYSPWGCKESCSSVLFSETLFLIELWPIKKKFFFQVAIENQRPHNC